MGGSFLLRLRLELQVGELDFVQVVVHLEGRGQVCAPTPGQHGLEQRLGSHGLDAILR
jgi:hypothetical protein